MKSENRHYWMCEDSECIVCKDYVEWREKEARPYVIAHVLEQKTDTNNSETLEQWL